ncbi:hypothetical protein [Vibrio alginolyticus]|nr:hypothetical protein [Vibrio alginolyticus]ELA8259993.1 hypothetical protein [Vibrio alginolyticus]
MAAKKSITLVTGITVADAIHRIESVTIGYKNKAKYVVRVYVSLDKPSFHEYSGEFDYLGGSALDEAYNNLNQAGGFVSV